MVSAANGGGRTSVRIAVVGDRGTGKSSLIAAGASGSFPYSVPRVLPPTRLPGGRIPTTLVDTSTSVEDKESLYAQIRAADAIVLTYDCGRPSTIHRVSSYWLPELRRLKTNLYVLVVGCKQDVQGDSSHLETPQIMRDFREIETCMLCSALEEGQARQVFNYAQNAVLYPTAPLFDKESQTLQCRCASALKRIFFLCDQDSDGALNDAEMIEFQYKCFNVRHQSDDIDAMKKFVAQNVPQGVDDRGLTLSGFLYLHAFSVQRGDPETTWTVVREFGYDDDLKIKEDLLPTSIFKRASDQSVELTKEGVDFLKDIFFRFDVDSDASLKPAEVEALFATAPESPWSQHPYKDAAEKNASGGLSLNGFLSLWALMTLLDPVSSMANLVYIGFQSNPASAFHVTGRRRIDYKCQQSQINVFYCFVFGPTTGISTLLDALVRRKFSNRSTFIRNERFAANVVELPGVTGNRKTLVMREVRENDVKTLLSNKESLAACDIALFVHDSFDEKSWNKAVDLRMQVANLGEKNGFEVPCILVCIKDGPTSTQASTSVIKDTSTESSVPVSLKLSDSNIFLKIVNAAQEVHLTTPETKFRKSLKQYRKPVNRSLVLFSVGAAAATIGLAAYRAYLSRKISST